MKCCQPGWRLGCFALGLGMLVCATDRGLTQNQIKTKDSLNRPFFETQTRRNKLMMGEETNLTAEDKKVAEASAHWFIYRVTHKPADTPRSHYFAVQNDFSKEVDFALVYKEKNKAFLRMWATPLVDSMREVFATQDIKTNPTVIVNASMMLPTMAKLKQDQIGDYLAALVNDEKASGVVRLYAIKALKEHMPVRLYQDDLLGLKGDKVDKVRDVGYVNALRKVIEQKIDTEGMAPEEVATVRYFRREAIMSLAHAGLPAVAITGKEKQIEGPIAPTLLLTLSKNGLQPPPSLQEKIEAALGLCAIKHGARMPEYQPDIAIYLIGETILEFVGEFNKDYNNFAVKGKERRIPTIAWKTECLRLDAGLKSLTANTLVARPKDNKAAVLEKQANVILMQYMNKYVQPDNEKVNDLAQFVAGIKPKGDPAVFATPKAPVIPLK